MLFLCTIPKIVYCALSRDWESEWGKCGESDNRAAMVLWAILIYTHFSIPLLYTLTPTAVPLMFPHATGFYLHTWCVVAFLFLLNPAAFPLSFPCSCGTALQLPLPGLHDIPAWGTWDGWSTAATAAPCTHAAPCGPMPVD